MTTYRKKLIEVALPLEAINVASAREKSIRHGHPSTLHLWWARRPLAADRAAIRLLLFRRRIGGVRAWLRSRALVPGMFPSPALPWLGLFVRPPVRKNMAIVDEQYAGVG